jgi:1,4-alpha-glucan branching enzyme
VILLGDFNNYKPMNEYVMKRDGDLFWTTVEGLQSGVEYGYQFLVDDTIKIGDPYATKILDPWNDKYISSATYPNLKPYPAEYTTDIVSVFDIDEVEYSWQVTDFERPDENMLAIYELIIRDFTTNGTIDAVTAKLDYFETLGINAIELMPIQEFDGNDSWGYNPCFYFATDKAYGTDEAYKRFIDECHKRGIAVIVDVVFNVFLTVFLAVLFDAGILIIDVIGREENTIVETGHDADIVIAILKVMFHIVLLFNFNIAKIFKLIHINKFLIYFNI